MALDYTHLSAILFNHTTLKRAPIYTIVHMWRTLLFIFSVKSSKID